ncbi:hypothetical protein [Azospirillum sp. sgz301742]
MAESRDAVAERLAAAGIGARAARCTALHMRKIAVVLDDGAGFVKVALHPASVAAVRVEAAAYAGPLPAAPYGRPVLKRFHDGGDWAALWLSAEAGRPMPSWRSLLPRPGPFEDRFSTRPAADLLGDPMPPPFEDWRRRLVDRFGDCTVRTAPAHGDFIYWNVLSGGPDGPVLIDFEQHEPCAPASHDRLFWTFVPLARKALALRCGQALAAAAPALARRLVPEAERSGLELALLVLRHGARMAVEHERPDIGLLYDSETVRLQHGLIALYKRVLGRLLP